MIFADASALVAVLAREVEAEALFSRLETTDRRFHSPVSMWETVAALKRSYALEDETADRVVRVFLQRLDFQIVQIGAREADLALVAWRRYGRGRHPAGLNMGDCFSYACAKSVGAALLYKGEDFAKTDLA